MNIERIKQLAELSADIYKHDCSDFKAYACNCDTDTEISIFKHDHGYTVVFRGTDSFADWVDNIKYIPVHFAGLRVHKGYRDNVMSVMHTIESNVSGLDRVTFTGHSKGGAEADIASEYWLYKYSRMPECVTFGAPACFYGAHENSTIRIVNEHDPVTRAGTRLGFSHGSKPQRIGRSRMYSGIVDILNPARKYTSCHSISEYRDNL